MNVKSEISQMRAPPARNTPIVGFERSPSIVLSTTASRIASRIGYAAQTLRTNSGTVVSLTLAEIQNCHRMRTAMRAITAMSIRPSRSRRVRRWPPRSNWSMPRPTARYDASHGRSAIDTSGSVFLTSTYPWYTTSANADALIPTASQKRLDGPPRRTLSQAAALAPIVTIRNVVSPNQPYGHRTWIEAQHRNDHDERAAGRDLDPPSYPQPR